LIKLPALCITLITQSCPHTRKPAASLMAALERSSWGIDVHQDFYVVVEQEGGSNPKPPQRFGKEAFLHRAAKLARSVAEVHAVYEACGFGFALQRKLSALGIRSYVVCPQKLDEQVKTDGLDAKALCLKLERFVQGNGSALAIVRVPTEKEEQLRVIHRQREQLVKVRKQLEAQGRNLMVNQGIEPVKSCWATLNRCCWPCMKRSAHSPASCKRPRNRSNRAGWAQ